MPDPRSAPVGLLDSGVGGLTVVRAVLDLLPHETLHYIGDTAHAPYGPRPAHEIRSLAADLADQLLDDGCKAVVIACNSAAAAGADTVIRACTDVPVLEVITPAARRALAATRTGRIGVIATVATVAAGAYPRAIRALAGSDGPEVVQQACPSFVDFVEHGLTTGRQITGLAQAYLDPLQRAEIDTLVLGCTHYPLLAPVLQQIVGDDVTLVSSAEETARDLAAVLAERDLLAPPGPQKPRHRVSATSDAPLFPALAERFLEPAGDGGAPAAR